MARYTPASAHCFAQPASTGDVQRCASDMARLVRGKDQNSVGDLARLADAADRHQNVRVVRIGFARFFENGAGCDPPGSRWITRLFNHTGPRQSPVAAPCRYLSLSK